MAVVPRIVEGDLLIGAGVGGGAAQRVMDWMREELRGADFDGEVRIVQYRS